MSVEESISEIQQGLKGIDKMIPPKEELQKYHYNNFNYTLHNPIVTIQYPEWSWTIFDSLAAIALVIGLLVIGAIMHTIVAG